MSDLTYYDLLHVAQDADDHVIRAAYRILAKRHHPDTNPTDRQLAAARFRLIQEAYDHLRDPARRRAYDDRLTAKRWRPPAPQNDNTNQIQASDMFSSARRTLERLMRIMVSTRDMRMTHSPRQDR